MKVGELMNHQVVTVSPHTKVAELARLMLDRGLAGMPVTDEAGTLLGIVTERDLVAKHATVHASTYFGILGGVIPMGRQHMDEEMRHVLAVNAEDLMSAATTVAPDAEIDDVASLMADEGINPIVVEENGALVGIVSHTEIIRLLLVEESDDDTTV